MVRVSSPAKLKPWSELTAKMVIRNNRKGGTATLRSRTCVKRNVAFGARFKGLSLYFLYQNGKLIRIKTGLDTYLIRIQTRTPLWRYPPYDYSWWWGWLLGWSVFEITSDLRLRFRALCLRVSSRLVRSDVLQDGWPPCRNFPAMRGGSFTHGAVHRTQGLSTNFQGPLPLR